MKKYIYAIMVLSLIIFHISLSSTVHAQIKGDVELLKLAVVKYRANIDKIKTWRGGVMGTNKSPTGISEWTANYACDLSIPAKRWNTKLEINVHVIDGKERSTPVRWNYGMYREGTYYNLLFDEHIKDARHVISVSKNPYAKPSYNNDVFDPEFFFTFDGAKFDEFFMHVHDNADQMTGYIVKKIGDIIILEGILEQYGPLPVTEYTIDLNKGGNVTQVIMRTNESNMKGETIWKWMWQEIDGVWVPKEALKDTISTLPEAKEYHNRILWKTNEVNIPLASDEFSLQKLGVRQGDLLLDSRTNTKTRITDPSFPPEVAFKKKPFAGKPAVPRSRTLFGGSYLVIACLVGLFVFGAVLFLRIILRKRHT